MRYRPFGRTGLQVSVVGFGCWPMAGDRYGAIEDGEAVKAIHPPTAPAIPRKWSPAHWRAPVRT